MGKSDTPDSASQVDIVGDAVLFAEPLAQLVRAGHARHSGAADCGVSHGDTP